MTEEEAKTKWCPKYQVATSGGDTSTFETSNRYFEYKNPEDTKQRWIKTDTINAECSCVGTKCMAWRWDIPAVSGHGYCGLAGKP